MIRKILKKKKVNNANFFVEPDEIFLDSKNLENFDRQQFEGRIEKPITRGAIFMVGIFFLLFLSAFSIRLGYLQIQKGEAYLKKSNNNTLEKEIILGDRGIIYDRNKVELVWNKKDLDFSVAVRAYLSPGFSHILGYVSYPAKDKSGNYWQTEFKGMDGLEKQYDEILRGNNGAKIVETDAHGKIYSENIVNPPTRGKDLVTTIDSKIQRELWRSIKDLSQRSSFEGGAGVIMDIWNGEIISAASYPEYDSSVLSLGKDSKKITGYLEDRRKLFLDRTISGLYTPGSIVKPFFAIGALTENIIDPYKKILSTGSISIPNPYFPEQKSIFKDWKAHGWVDMREAIAVSSDVYFYEIGGGFEGQKGMGIVNIEKYSNIFGIGQKTGIDLPDEKGGIIPSPLWKAKNFKGEPWRVGDTYNTSIGQYGFQVTPMEMTRAVSAIANYGTLPSPHYILGDRERESVLKKINLRREHYDVAREGMRQSVLSGTSILLNVPYVKVASKTGTAQVGISKNKINSWIMGFFPYDNPRYAFTVMMESGPANGSIGAVYVMRELFDWMSVNTPQYFINPSE